MAELNVQKVPSAEDRSLPIFAELDELADRIRLQAYNLFAGRGGSEGHALDDWLAAEHEVCWPATELVERADAFALEVALAGFAPSEVTVTATPREVIVKAARKSEKDTKAGELKWSEFRRSDVYRRVELPADVEVANISASLHNGLLKIVAPKAAAKQPAAAVKVTAVD